MRKPGDIRSRKGDEVAIGRGVLVGQGLVVTAAHLLEGSHEVVVSRAADPKVLRATALVKDSGSDVALLAVPALAGDSTSPKSQVARATPKNATMHLPSGRVAIEMGAKESVSLRGKSVSLTRIQAQAKPGDSGSPIFDRRGRVAGIVAASSGADDSVSFAAPAGAVRRLLASTSDGHLSR